MAKLTTAQRKAIPKSDYGVPSKAPGPGSYPMPNRSHAANAEARASGKPVQAQVDRKAHQLYPDLGKRTHAGHADHLQSEMGRLAKSRHGHHG